MPVLRVTSGGSTTCTPRWDSGGWWFFHEHKVYLPCAGSADYDLPAGRRRLLPGRCYLIPGGRPHRFACPRRFSLHFFHLLVDDPLTELRLLGLRGIVSWPRAAVAWWRPAWTALARMRGRGQAITGPDLAAKLAAFAGWLIADCGERGLLPPVVPGSLERLAPALRRLCGAGPHPELPELAALAGLSPSHFHRLFKRAFGITPQRWLEGRLLARARHLLLATDLAVGEVARRLGYHDPAYFSRVCRRRLGAGPRAIRARAPAP